MRNDRFTFAQERRILAGLAVQPFVAAGVGFATTPLIEAVNRATVGGRSSDLLDVAASIAAGGALTAFFVTILVAAPAVAWCLHRGPLTVAQVLWGGVAIGSVPVLLIGVLGAAGSGRGGDALGGLLALATGAWFGLAGAFVFWLIGVRGNGKGVEA